MKPIEEKIVGTLDEIVYGMVPATAVYSDPDEFAGAQEIFKFSQTGRDFSFSMQWNEWLLPQLEKNANDTAQREREYKGIDKEKKEQLWLNRVCADYALELVKGIVEDARDFPRPVFQKSEQTSE